ncbi:hypothetical protein PPERSA_03921 [Pseudocohnilembus persalinus]|uniref:Histidine phosphatase superfamily n=1 Tax=Pseudocohnilembus persalinus TaxID=266149 RepID=A0A0V0R5V5_PSEPJ|nr:hypothetical protein PPERSA_03921 [Pseudocohnilembus persalinus]|eukprot:KRX09859.1 hypothetical protein PPERSA_03921 [Pseudocohnilembus persalinus]
MLFGIRHGERGDRCHIERKTVQLDHDPHLTKLGCLQAQASGQRLEEEIQNYFKHLKQEKLIGEDEKDEIEIIMLSSPFLRTMMTAFHLAQQIKKRVYKKTIYLQYEFCENIANYDFSEDPLKDLFIVRQNQEQQNKNLSENEKCNIQNQYQLKSYFLWNYYVKQIYFNSMILILEFQIQQYIDVQNSDLKFEYDGLFKNEKSWIPTFPERNNKKRVYTAIEGLLDFYLTNFDHKKYVVLYVSHQSIVEEGLRYFGKSIQQWSSEYCALLGVRFNDPVKNGIKNYEVLIDCDSSHADKVQIKK